MTELLLVYPPPSFMSSSLKSAFPSQMNRHPFLWGILLGALGFLLIYLVGSRVLLQGTSESMSAMPSSYDSYERAEMGMMDLAGVKMADSGFVPNGGDFDNVAESERSVIRTGTLNLRVESVTEAIKLLTEQTQVLKGTVTSSQQNRLYTGAYAGFFVARVPAEQFTLAMEQYKALADEVYQETSDAQDVTSAVMDLEKRLENKRLEETQYREILARATLIQDVLTTTQYLSGVRYEIESMEAELKNINQSVAFSTITVNLDEDPQVAAVSESWKPLRTLTAALREWVGFLQWGVDSLIYVAIFSWPLVLLAGGFWMWRRWKR